jgi:hypothetical protein
MSMQDMVEYWRTHYSTEARKRTQLATKESKDMNRTAAKACMQLFLVISIITMIVVGIYTWLLPRFSIDLKTYAFLIAGIAAAAVAGGYLGHKHGQAYASAIKRRTLTIGCGTVAALLVTYFSLFFILNIAGA